MYYHIIVIMGNIISDSYGTLVYDINNPNNNLLTKFSIKNNVKRLNHDSIHKLSWLIKNANDFGKSIVRTSMLNDNNKLWLHKIFVNGETINNYGIHKKNNFDNCNMIEYSEDNYKKINITLNHYAIRNLEDYEKKINKLIMLFIKIILSLDYLKC